VLRFGVIALITVLTTWGETSAREADECISHWSDGISGSYIHMAAFGCSVYVETAYIASVELERRGDITVSPVRSSPDSLFCTCSGGREGSIYIRIPSSTTLPVITMEHENSFVSIEGVSIHRMNNSGIEGAIFIKSCSIDTLIGVLDKCSADLDVKTVITKFNTCDSHIQIRGRMNDVTVICEGGTLVMDVSPDTLLCDLKSTMSDIMFRHQSVRSGLIIAYAGEMRITVPDPPLNRLLFRAKGGELSMDETLPITRKSSGNAYREVTVGMVTGQPPITVVTRGTAIELTGS